MEKIKKKLLFILVVIVTFLYLIFTRTLPEDTGTPRQHEPPKVCPVQISDDTITQITNTKHLLLSAFMDQRVNGWDIRIIGVFKRDSIKPLHCLFCCVDDLSNSTTPAQIEQHSDNFGFPFVTTDIMCQIPEHCRATHVTLLTETDSVNVTNKIWLPIRNQKTEKKEEEKLQFNFTVCISTLFGNYNNVLQFAQTLEMYRLLGVDRVVIYNTSCGPDLDRLLKSYAEEGFVEMVPWPIDQYLTPSPRWNPREHGGDLHYYGQLTTLNECIYRSMARSRYVLLNDIDEIIMPYQHNHLMPMMDMLQKQHPQTGVFLIENHIFPKKHFEPSRMFHLRQWNEVPGINILEHIYREEPDRTRYHPHKMIVQPRMVQQTSVHEVLKNFGQVYKVPLDICRIIHVRVALRTELKLEELRVDKRLWDFQEKLILRVDEVLKRVGMLDRRLTKSLVLS